MSPGSSVSIAVLLPDVLGTYSDAGNATVLAQRLRWRGIDAEIVDVTASGAPPTGCSLYLLGGGEDTAQFFAARWLREHPGLLAAMDERAVTLAVCAGLQLLGHHMVDRQGEEHPGAGLLDLTTRPSSPRAVGETVAMSRVPGIGLLTGFANHGGATELGPDTPPLADVRSGPPNAPTEPVDGAVGPASRGAPPAGPGIVGTYLHGPVLARNPALADHLLARAVGHDLPPLDADRLPDLDALREQYLSGTAG